jgi:hypothetical protein
MPAKVEKCHIVFAGSPEVTSEPFDYASTRGFTISQGFESQRISCNALGEQGLDGVDILNATMKGRDCNIPVDANEKRVNP